jgi:hypothetical protein
MGTIRAASKHGSGLEPIRRFYSKRFFFLQDDTFTQNDRLQLRSKSTTGSVWVNRKYAEVRQHLWREP